MTHTIRLRAGVIAVAAGIFGMAPLAIATSTSSSAAETIATTYVTGYSYYDNDPPGSPDISDPVIHQKAGGTGTYADPTTVAVGIVNGKPMFTPGTRFYIPNLRQYFMVEDTCAECANNVPSGASNWIDLWIDGSATSTSASESCMNAITGNWKTIKDPASNYAVTAGVISKASGCTAQYGNTVVFATPPTTTTTTVPPTKTTTTTAPPPKTTAPTVAPTKTTAPTVAPTKTTPAPVPTTAAKAASLQCPVVVSPTVGQKVTCTYR